MFLFISFLALAGGLILLIYSAEKFVSSSVVIARQFGVSRLLIGLTVVSLGTSAPEIMVSTMASLSEAPEIAIGNAIGSNIANIGLVLGLTAIVVPLPFALSVLKFEMPWLLLATFLVAVVLLYDMKLSRIDGVLLLALLFVGMHQMFRTARKRAALPGGLEAELDELEDMSRGKSIMWLLFGLALLLLSAEMIVWGAKNIAYWLGVSEMVVGLTVVALGTSLPELAATLTAAVKKQPEIAIGNVVGSNILNILAVLPVPALLHPHVLSTIHVWRDFGAMFAFTMLLALFAYGIRSRKIVTRFEGCVLLMGYFGFMTLLVVSSLKGSTG